MMDMSKVPICDIILLFEEFKKKQERICQGEEKNGCRSDYKEKVHRNKLKKKAKVNSLKPPDVIQDDSSSEEEIHRNKHKKMVSSKPRHVIQDDSTSDYEEEVHKNKLKKVAKRDSLKSRHAIEDAPVSEYEKLVERNINERKAFLKSLHISQLEIDNANEEIEKKPSKQMESPFPTTKENNTFKYALSSPQPASESNSVTEQCEPPEATSEEPSQVPEMLPGSPDLPTVESVPVLDTSGLALRRSQRPRKPPSKLDL